MKALKSLSRIRLLPRPAPHHHHCHPTISPPPTAPSTSRITTQYGTEVDAEQTPPRSTFQFSIPQRHMQDVLLNKLEALVQGHLNQLNLLLHNDDPAHAGEEAMEEQVKKAEEDVRALYAKYKHLLGKEQRQEEDALQMATILATMMASLVTDRMVSLRRTRAGAGDGTYEWMEGQIANVMMLSNACCKIDEEGSFADPEAVAQEWHDLAWSIPRMLHFRPRAHLHSYHTAALLHIWIDVFVLRPLDNFDRNTQNAIAMVRQQLMEKKTDSGDSKAAQLCTTVVNTILVNDPKAYDLVIDILEQMHRNTELSIAMTANVIVNKCRQMSVAEKWSWCMEVHHREGVSPPTPTIDRLLLECTMDKDWTTGDEIMRFLHDTKVPLDHYLSYRLIGLTSDSRSPELALRAWESISDNDIKWHGLVLLRVLQVAVANRQHSFWKKTIRKILNVAESENGGQWPTGFFETRTQRSHFLKLSQNIITSLNHWSKKDSTDKDESENAVLARKWEAFKEDQLNRFATKGTRAKGESNQLQQRQQ